MTDFEAIVAQYRNDPEMQEVYATAQAEINKIQTRRARIAAATLAVVATAVVATTAVIINQNK